MNDRKIEQINEPWRVLLVSYKLIEISDSVKEPKFCCHCPKLQSIKPFFYSQTKYWHHNCVRKCLTEKLKRRL